MLDCPLPALKWLAVAAALSPIAAGLGWAVVEGVILPRLVSRAEIEALADAVLRDHPDAPEAWAAMEEHAAWHRSLGFEQAKWRRIRKALRRRLPPPGA
ncbi:hypothetical protein [Zavarzinia compransoris]|uniref:Uncharacterized protein n=1 Tax=Zavarzinia compransoris TaxID=1264899 RepID=A0A317DWH8_9PROT|nr:hypothetical protein [Zavarzinia compransoris]PWR19049.1 hypothetical protein DKG75_18980 [Zavarzinia compransoris]TDP49056.1 hypothetical protein DES42_101417 [Zavarzinia compransoris]